MAKRYIDVYEDATDAQLRIGVRDDGATTLWTADVSLKDWTRYVDTLRWFSAAHAESGNLSADRGALIGRVEYDDGLPDVACEPST